MSAHLGLYFPSFHFPDDEWVKLSALYWDKMYRIVPDKYETPRDTETVIKLAHPDSRFINNLHPEEFYHEMRETTEAFRKLIREHHGELIRKYGVVESSNWLSRLGRQKKKTNLASINNLKIQHFLHEDLLESGLGIESKESDYIEMHPKLVNVYMAALAKAMAGGQPFNASPITNSPINYFAVGGFSFERLAQILLDDVEILPKNMAPEEIESRVAFLVIKSVQPENIKDVPVEKILAVREKYKNEMGHFQDFIQAMVNELPNVKEAQSSPFVNDFLEKQYEKKVKPKLDDLEESLKSLGIKTVESFLNLEIKVPSLITSAGLAVAINPVVGVTTGLGFGLFKTYGEIRDRRKSVENKIQNSDVAFLLRVKEDLAPIKSLNWLQSRLRHFTFGV